MTDDQHAMPTEERDESILRFLAERNAIFKPKALFENLREYENITFGYKTVKRRLNELEERGLVERVDLPDMNESSYRRITDRGRAYLAGDLDADDLSTE